MRDVKRALPVLILSLHLVACTGVPLDEATSTESPTATSTVPSPPPSPTTATTAPSATATNGPRFCTEIGCDSTLTIELTEVDITPEATYDVEICVNGVCAAETIAIDERHPGTGEIERGESRRTAGRLAGLMVVWAEGDHIVYHLPEREYDSSASVTFMLTASDGTVLAQTDGTTEVPLERSQPNGPDCPPVCFSGRIAV